MSLKYSNFSSRCKEGYLNRIRQTPSTYNDCEEDCCLPSSANVSNDTNCYGLYIGYI